MSIDDPHIRIGTAGWSYEDWQGIVYPRRPKPPDELKFLAAYFDVLEVNSSFYRPPISRTTASWIQRTAARPDFRFTFKMHQRFTHQRESPWSTAEAREFREGLAPVAEAGRLGGVLLQFPWSFKADSAAFQWLRRLADEFGQWPLVVEVRHDSWNRNEPREELRKLGVAVASIDQPLLEHCLKPSVEVAAGLGYVRLHGRNREKWFAEDSGPNERYNYLYSQQEIDEWVERIRDMSQRAKEVYVIANNHYRGQAAANALQIMSKVQGRPVPVPETMIVEYPFLEAIAARPQETPGSQGELF
jgi:uncharacterized protein YecE (DUF72 family)